MQLIDLILEILKNSEAPMRRKEIVAKTVAQTSERGETRIDDRIPEAAMKDRKKNGYF